MLRISGGKHRNRRLEPPEDLSVRPTAERARLAIFNRLAHGLLASDGAGLDGIRVVDVFAGSGALGFEALSRGAAHITFIEKDRRAAQDAGCGASRRRCEARPYPFDPSWSCMTFFGTGSTSPSGRLPSWKGP